MLHHQVERMEETRKGHQSYEDAFKFFKGIGMTGHSLPFLSN